MNLVDCIGYDCQARGWPTRISALAAVAMMLSIATAQAQQAPSGSAKPQVTTPIAGIDDTALAGSARASKLIGSKVYNGDTTVGQIEDVLVDLDKATVTAVILSVGGVLGVGDKHVAVPVNQIKVGKEARFMTDLTKDQLTSAPVFDFGKLQ